MRGKKDKDTEQEPKPEEEKKISKKIDVPSICDEIVINQITPNDPLRKEINKPQILNGEKETEGLEEKEKLDKEKKLKI